MPSRLARRTIRGPLVPYASRRRIAWKSYARSGVLAVGTRLTIRAENRFAYEGFREILGRVDADGKTVAEATLLLLRSGPDEAENPKSSEKEDGDDGI